MTGSDKTHDAILWGGHGDVRARKADPKAAPNLSKPVCAELGCVVPLIVVPGEWSEAELDRKVRVRVRVRFRVRVRLRVRVRVRLRLTLRLS